MGVDRRRVRGPLVIEVVRALRSWMRSTESSSIAGLGAADHALVTAVEIDPAAWYSYPQYLRLIDASFERSCDRDWAQLHELCARGVAGICERGYAPLLDRAGLGPALTAISLLWRASYDFGYAIADTDPGGATISVTDCPDIGALAGNVNVGWCLGLTRRIGATVGRIELRRRPWAGEGDEQVIRLHWTERVSEPTPDPAPRELCSAALPALDAALTRAILC